MTATARVRVYGFPVSTWTRTATMTCIEKGIDHELVPLALRGPEHAALHPFVRIPVLEHDGRVIVESLAITGYLDEAFAGPSLQPGDHAPRARMRFWMGVCGDYVFRDVVLTIPRKRPPTDAELSTARTVLERLEGQIGAGPFLAGDAVTLADLYLAPQISNAAEKAPEVLAGLEALGAWMARIGARESFRRTAYDPTRL